MHRTERLTILTTAGLLATVGFVALSTAVATRSTSRFDRALRPRLKLNKGRALRRGADALAPLGKWYATMPAAAGLSAWVLAHDGRNGARRAPRAGAAAIVCASAIAAGAAKVFDRTLPQPPPPPGHRSRTKPVYPSGHALVTGAPAITAAYVLRREGMIGPRAALAAGVLIPLVSAGGKVVEEKHWASDVLGGALAASAVACACMAAYEASR